MYSGRSIADVTSWPTFQQRRAAEIRNKTDTTQLSKDADVRALYDTVCSDSRRVAVFTRLHPFL